MSRRVASDRAETVTTMRVLFLGNHTVGVRALRVIHAEASLVGVVAHPADAEDGVRYESVYTCAKALGVPVIRASGGSAELESFVAACRPDLIWITDYRYLVSGAVLNLAPLGAINLHPSLLPKYRGRAPINWAILRGETEFGLTAHVVDEGMDSGEIVAQRRFTLSQDEDVGDALNKLYPMYEDITRDVLHSLAAGRWQRSRQNHDDATAFPRRRPTDGLIDWSLPAREVWNLVRAVAAPYPGAFTSCRGGTMRVWHVAGIEPFSALRCTQPGEVIQATPDGHCVTVACGDAALTIDRFDLEDGADLPELGDVLLPDAILLSPS